MPSKEETKIVKTRNRPVAWRLIIVCFPFGSPILARAAGVILAIERLPSSGHVRHWWMQVCKKQKDILEIPQEPILLGSQGSAGHTDRRIWRDGG